MGFIYDWRSTATTPTATCASGEVSRRPSYYRGEQYDSDLGLYYLRARYYNPGTGRFLSRDPLDGDATQPATLHRYLYVGGDPVNLWDPRGRGAAEYQLTLIPGGTAAAVVLPELTAGAAQFLAVAQLYAGLPTSQPKMF